MPPKQLTFKSIVLDLLWATEYLGLVDDFNSECCAYWADLVHNATFNDTGGQYIYFEDAIKRDRRSRKITMTVTVGTL